ncbi:hypothetical protein [Kitasatospora sp. NPDC001547]|uniref:hypothetical protein n=1 Tax=Kitasatospora sp. NPDC001547 TaxID=3364015 RepID=UPI0036A4305C
MSALVAERTVAVNLDQSLWQAWESVDVPEGFRAEIVDDHDDGGAVTVLTDPDAGRRDCTSSTRAPYGKEAVIPERPARGFVVGPGITGELRG